MATDVTRDEFKRLETRVDIVESEVEGEKMVSRHILDQTRRNADDLAAIENQRVRIGLAGKRSFFKKKAERRHHGTGAHAARIVEVLVMP